MTVKRKKKENGTRSGTQTESQESGKTTASSSPKEVNQSIYADLNAIRYAREQEDAALRRVLADPTIRKKIQFEAAKFASRNPELSRDELERTVPTILYSAIIKEWRRDKDPEKAISWCCSRIGWRTATHVQKEVQLIYKKPEANEKGVYNRLDTTDLTDDVIGQIGKKASPNQRFALLTDLIRDAKIHPNFKHPLIYVIVLGFSFRELARIYNCTAPTASNIYKKSLAALKEHIEKTSGPEAEALFETIKEILDG